MESSLSSGSDCEVNMFVLVEAESPICRCEFVWKWLDDHEELLMHPPPPDPQPLCCVTQYTYGPPGICYFYSEPIPCLFPHRDVRLPYILPAPHRVSPMRPVYY